MKKTKKQSTSQEMTPEADFLRFCELREGKLIRYFGKETDVVIPEGITAIGAHAF